ncbi:MAG: redoxin domain-containing protein [Cyanobacteria bacterium REEB65]|nr:redoxin domain-containing protein [Cyanobacteria bacterium REEB65]
MRDYYPKIRAHADLMAISYEDPVTERQFKAKFHLPFPLLSDTSYRAIDEFGGREPNNTFAKPATWVINPAGILTWYYIGQNPADRPPIEMVLKAIGA